MPKYVVWNVEAARLETPKPVSHSKASKLADALERKHRDMYVVAKAQ